MNAVTMGEQFPTFPISGLQAISRSLLKGCLKIYSGFCLSSGVVRPIDQEMTDTEKIVCYSEFPRGGGSHTLQGHTEEHQGCQEAEGSGQSTGKSFIVVSMGRNGKGRLIS